MQADDFAGSQRAAKQAQYFGLGDFGLRRFTNTADADAQSTGYVQRTPLEAPIHMDVPFGS